jgi:hypothetical protein
MGRARPRGGTSEVGFLDGGRIGSGVVGHRTTDREAAVGTNREGHRSFAGWRIVKGSRTIKPQGEGGKSVY